MEKDFGEALRALRTEHNMTQQQLADALHVDRSTIAYWESGKRTPDIATVRLIADSFDIDVVELLSAPTSYEEKNIVIAVDDEKLILSGNLEVIREAMPKAEVKGFTRSSEAVAFAKNNPVALAFLDIEMGKTIGLDLCRTLLEINPRTNVVFLTAYMDYSFRAWDTGACGFLMKPLTVEAVERQLGMLRHPIRGI